jgi:hypothetical protein
MEVMKIRVEEYIRPDGSIPYKKWFDSLDAQAAARLLPRRFARNLATHRM